MARGSAARAMEGWKLMALLNHAADARRVAGGHAQANCSCSTRAVVAVCLSTTLVDPAAVAAATPPFSLHACRFHGAADAGWTRQRAARPAASRHSGGGWLAKLACQSVCTGPVPRLAMSPSAALAAPITFSATVTLNCWQPAARSWRLEVWCVVWSLGWACAECVACQTMTRTHAQQRHCTAQHTSTGVLCTMLTLLAASV